MENSEDKGINVYCINKKMTIINPVKVVFNRYRNEKS